MANYLVGTNESPLKKAILESGIAYDMNMYVDSENAQPYLSFSLFHMDPNRKNEAISIATNVLATIAENGIDKDELYAGIDQLEYMLKDVEEPAGLIRNGIVIGGWTYYNDPSAGMDVEADLAVLREYVENGRYTELLKDITLKDCSEFMLLPRAEYEQDDKEEEAREELLDWQNEEENPLVLAAIPKISIDDIKETVSFLDTEHYNKNGADVLFHKAKTDGINHYSLYFTLADCSVEEMQILSFMTNLFNCLPTENYNLPTLEREMKCKIGKVDYNVIAYSTESVTECRPMFHVTFSCLEKKEEKAFEIIAEIMRHTNFTDEKSKEMIYQILMQGQDDLFQAIISDGSHYAGLRAMSHLQATSALIEKTEGYTFYQYISQITGSFETVIDDFAAKMSELSKKVFTASRMTVSITVPENRNQADILTSLFSSNNEIPCENQLMTIVPDGKCEAEHITVPSIVSYAASAGLLPNLRDDYCGQYEVLANIMNLEYLWSNIRVQGGAYGCGSYILKNGGFGFSSYRDPNPENSLVVFENSYKLVDSIPESIESYIIGAYAHRF